MCQTQAKDGAILIFYRAIILLFLPRPMQFSALPRGSFTERWGNGVTLNFGFGFNLVHVKYSQVSHIWYSAAKLDIFMNSMVQQLNISDMNSADVLHLDVSARLALITIGGVRDSWYKSRDILRSQQRGIWHTQLTHLSSIRVTLIFSVIVSFIFSAFWNVLTNLWNNKDCLTVMSFCTQITGTG